MFDRLFDKNGSEIVRKVRDGRLETRTARAKLRRTVITFKGVGPGLAVGYRRGKRGGKWVARFYRGDRSYTLEVIGPADDIVEPDGVRVLSWWQAVDKAQDLHKQRGQAEARLGPYKVEDAVGDYLAYLADHKKGAREVAYRMHAHVLPVFGNKEVSKLTKAEITRWHRNLAEQPPRLRTKSGKEQRHRKLDLDNEEAERKRKLSANRCLAQMKAALNMAVAENHVASDATWRKVKPFQGTDVARVRYLKVEEAKRLVNTCDGDFKLLVQAALLTGARYGELTRLNVGDFNPDTGTMHVRISKSGRGRHIVLTAEGSAFFGRITAGRSGGEPMLRNSTRTKQRTGGIDEGRWRKSEQLRPMREACKRAQISPPVGLHQLRHTWASLSAMAGMPLMVVARNLGHVDTRMVEKHYGHMSKDFIAKTIMAHAPTFGIVEPTNITPNSE